MRWSYLVAALAALPTPTLAHDAFGDLGPFYANLLHPMADPMQAALGLGTAAFLAGRSLNTVRLALPGFVASAALSYLFLGWRFGVTAAPIMASAVAIAVGAAAMLPERWTPVAAALVLVTGTGAFVGLSPDQPMPSDLAQAILGTLLGIAAFILIAWAMFDATARHVSRLAPAIVGSWVAAVGLLAGAFSFQIETADAIGVSTSRDGLSVQGADQ